MQRKALADFAGRLPGRPHDRSIGRPPGRRLACGALGLLALAPIAAAVPAAATGAGRGDRGPPGRGRADPAAPVALGGIAFGTRVRVVVAGLERPRAEAAARAALAEIVRIDRLTSLYQSGSDLARLNAAGRLDAADPLLATLLATARDWGDRTAGAFDVTVQPLWRWHAAATGADPSRERDVAGARERDVPRAREQALARAREFVDYRRIDPGRLPGTVRSPGAVRSPGDGHGPGTGRIRLLRPGMAVTLNGIAQGFAADRALAVLRSLGAEQVLVDAGEFVGTRQAGAPWRIGIRDPLGAAPAGLQGGLPGGLPGVLPGVLPGSALLPRSIDLSDAAVASSSDQAWRFTADGDLFHIFDPATGWSPRELAGVTVIAPDATTADALSTACMVLGVRRSLALLDGLAGCAALLVGRDGRRIATAGWPGPA